MAEGNTDVDAIAEAIEAAKAVTDKPSIIKVTTTIGYGSPNKADTAGVHGAALIEEGRAHPSATELELRPLRGAPGGLRPVPPGD